MTDEIQYQTQPLSEEIPQGMQGVTLPELVQQILDEKVDPFPTNEGGFQPSVLSQGATTTLEFSGYEDPDTMMTPVYTVVAHLPIDLVHRFYEAAQTDWASFETGDGLDSNDLANLVMNKPKYRKNDIFNLESYTIFMDKELADGNISLLTYEKFNSLQAADNLPDHYIVFLKQEETDVDNEEEGTGIKLAEARLGGKKALEAYFAHINSDEIASSRMSVIMLPLPYRAEGVDINRSEYGIGLLSLGYHEMVGLEFEKYATLPQINAESTFDAMASFPIVDAKANPAMLLYQPAN
ncbi:MAG: hypothetical protein KKF44_08175 [Nanoarchaeota archaeon]|nr:hypothetical protein [Nanoarchaeota archaeon]